MCFFLFPVWLSQIASQTENAFNFLTSLESVFFNLRDEHSDVNEKLDGPGAASKSKELL